MRARLLRHLAVLADRPLPARGNFIDPWQLLAVGATWARLNSTRQRKPEVVKLSRLWQPQLPLFWIWVAVNLLSAACAWALRALPLTGAGFALVAVLGLLNALLGMLLMWQLLRHEPNCSKDS